MTNRTVEILQFMCLIPFFINQSDASKKSELLHKNFTWAEIQ